jgi:hypothetical protein
MPEQYQILIDDENVRYSRSYYLSSRHSPILLSSQVPTGRLYNIPNVHIIHKLSKSLQSKIISNFATDFLILRYQPS